MDDVEDLNSTKTVEGRNNIFDWFTREVMPLGDINTRVILLGNLLHEDSLMMRLRKKIEAKETKGIFKLFPLLTEDGDCLWPGKFDTKEKIEELRMSVANELAWQQEYLLNIISDSTRVIFPEWLKYYESLPEGMDKSSRAVFMGVDLAISQRETADYTAIVIGALYECDGEYMIYILPNPVNKRMSFPEAIRTIKEMSENLSFNEKPIIVIESNGFQEIYVDQLKDCGLAVEGVKNATDKRARLAMTSYYIQSGMIRFPKNGAETLINQLVGFSIESHDDLSDAFSMMVIRSLETLKFENGFYNWLKFCSGNGGSCWF